MNEPLAHRTLSAAIVERLRRAILDGSHAAGTQLRQDALAANFGVSRIPVREALFQLEAEGLVRIEPHKGAVVSALSLQEVDDVFDLRALLEPRLLAASLPRLGEAELAEVAGLEAAFSAAVRAHDVSRWGALNAQLHRSLYRRAELPRTEAIVESLLQASDRYTRLQMNRLPAMARAEAEHRQLLQLCNARRTREACRYLVAHIEQVRQDLHALLKPQPVAGARSGTGKRTPKPKLR